MNLLGLLAVPIIAAGLSLAVPAAPDSRSIPLHDTTKQALALDLTQLDDSTRWVQLNYKSFRISRWLNELCRLPLAADHDRDRARNPHTSAFITVFITHDGAQAMRDTGNAAFPVGCTIVKKKYYAERGDVVDAEPSLYTVMIKREPGYNPECGDWEFAVVAADGRTVQDRGRIERCMGCHVKCATSDFLFRTYLPSQKGYLLGY